MEKQDMTEEMSRTGKCSGNGHIVIDVDGVSKSFTRWQRKEDTGVKEFDTEEKNASGKDGVGGDRKNFPEKRQDHRGRFFHKKGNRSFFKQEKKVVTALDNVSFQIRQGEFVAYAGPNGAGKSTTMKLLSGMLQPTGGRVSVLGMSPEKDRIALMKKLGVLFGNRTELWWDHPVIQSYEWKKVVWDIPDTVYKRNLDMVTELLDIGEIRNTFARELSLGQRMRADLAMMLLHSPELILLDEPTLGLDVVAKRQMIEFLKKVNQENGVTILVTSHDMDDLEEMARRIILISGGKLAFDGGFDGLREITGNLTHFTVTMDGRDFEPVAAGGRDVVPMATEGRAPMLEPADDRAAASEPAEGRASVPETMESRALVPEPADGRAPVLEGCRFLGGQRGVFEYEADLSRVPVKVLLERLSRMEGIQNVEIRKAPIEQVITQLYQAWKVHEV